MPEADISACELVAYRTDSVPPCADSRLLEILGIPPICPRIDWLTPETSQPLRGTQAHDLVALKAQGFHNHSFKCHIGRATNHRELQRLSGLDVILVVFALVISGVGLFLMLNPKQEGQNTIELFGAKFSLSTPALVLIIFGGLLLYQVVNENRRGQSDLVDNQDIEEQPNALPEGTKPTSTEVKVPNNKSIDKSISSASSPRAKKLESEDSATIEKQYNRAIESKNRKQYVAFLNKNPNGEFSEDIRDRLSSCVKINTKRIEVPVPQTKLLNFSDIHEKTDEEIGNRICFSQGHSGVLTKCVPETSLKENCDGGTCVSGPGVSLLNGKAYYSYYKCTASCYKETQDEIKVDDCTR